LKILPGMGASKPETIERLFAALGRRDLDAALELTTPDVVLDRSGSKGPFRGVERGHDPIRAATSEFRDPIGEMSWGPERIRTVGRDYAAVGT
jgi:ketosteroid isomerase-like protein